MKKSSAGDATAPQAPRRGGKPRATGHRSPRTLSRDAIIDAAIKVLDAEGLDAVTMRRVADELGTGPASLYAHVADKDEMVDLVYDRIISEVDFPSVIDPGNWQEQLKELCRCARRVMHRHKDIARASLANIPTGPGALPVMNAMLGILIEGGVSPEIASMSVDILALYFSATAYEESLEAFPTDPEGSAAFHAELNGFFAALPAEKYPYLFALAGPLTDGDGDDRFEFGLDMLVRGIASTVRPKGKKR